MPLAKPALAKLTITLDKSGKIIVGHPILILLKYKNTDKQDVMICHLLLFGKQEKADKIIVMDAGRIVEEGWFTLRKNSP